MPLDEKWFKSFVNDLPDVSTQIYTLFSGCEIAQFFGRYMELHSGVGRIDFWQPSHQGLYVGWMTIRVGPFDTSCYQSPHHLSFDSERFESTDASSSCYHHVVSSTCMSCCPLGWHARPLTRLVRNDSIIVCVRQIQPTTRTKTIDFSKIQIGRMNKRWNADVRITFTLFVAQIEHSRPWKVLRNPHFLFCSFFQIFAWDQPSATHPRFWPLWRAKKSHFRASGKKRMKT